MLTAFKIILSAYSGQKDIIVGSPVRRRTSGDLLQTIGYFVNTVALRSLITGDQSFEKNLQTVTQTCVEAFANEEIPFEILLKSLFYSKDPTRTAVFQTFFTFQDMTNRHFLIDQKPVQQVRVTNDEIRGAFEYRSDLFTAETIETMSSSFFKLLDELKFYQGVPIREIAHLKIPQTPIFCFQEVEFFPRLFPHRPSYTLPLISSKDTIEAIATDCIKGIKFTQPEGPYFLIGRSLGGMIAYEVAQQLALIGDKIEKIIMVDTFGPKSESFWIKLRNKIYYKRRSMFNRLITKLFKALELPIPHNFELFEMEEKNFHAPRKYKPKKIEGDIHLVTTGRFSDPKLGWGNMVMGKIEISIICWGDLPSACSQILIRNN